MSEPTTSIQPTSPPHSPSGLDSWRERRNERRSLATPQHRGDGLQFPRLLWRIASASVTAGNDVMLLRDGPPTFAAMEAMIGEARHFVGLESYIYHSDEVGEEMCDALIGAARRGAEVRLIYDWIGSRGLSRNLLTRLREAGVQTAVFNQPSLRRRWFGILPRDHRKLLVTDDVAGVTGGIGIGHEWTRGAARDRGQRWRDNAMRIVGPAALDMRAAFDRMWARAHDGWGPGRRHERVPMERPSDSPNQGAVDARPAMVGIVEGEMGRFRISRALQVQCALAERSLWIANAYFVPSPAEVESICGAARDGVDVRILVPSRNDHPWVTKLTRRYYSRLLCDGVRIWEWQGEMLHAKTAVVDGRFVRVGSTDFNMLGVAINYELDAVVDDATVGKQAEDMFLADLERSKEVLRTTDARA